MPRVSSCCACPADTFSSLTSRNLPCTAITLSSCNGASVVMFRDETSLCLASRRNARQGIGLVDHRLLRGLSIGLQGFFFVVVVGHDLLHHLLGPRNWALHDLWPGVSTVVSSICVRICGTRMANSTSGVAWSTTIAMVSQPMAPPPCETFISRGMLLWAHLCLWCSVVLTL